MKKVAIVGVEGSGKTVLMAAMGEKYRKPRADGLFLYANSRRTIEYCNEQIDILRNQHKWPNSTSPDSLVNLEWTLMRRKKGSRPEEICTVAFLDFAGEIYRYAFGDSTDDSDHIKQSQYKSQIDAIKSHVEDAEALIVLVNLSDIINSRGASKKASEIDWLSQRIFDFTVCETNVQHFAVVFTQKDLYTEIIAGHGGVDDAFGEYLPAVFCKYETIIAPFAISAVNKTLPDEAGNLIPAPDFESDGLDELVSWMANFDESHQVPRQARWYRKAAEMGNAIAQNNLGFAYEHGYGVEQDYGQAVSWYLKAAEQGDETAQCNLGISFANGHGVERDYSKAVEWYRLAAEQGNALAQCNLGVMYETGRGIKQDYFEAIKWYRLAAEQGNSMAQYNIGVAYDNGKGVNQDSEEAFKWYKRASDGGNENARRILSEISRCRSTTHRIKAFVGRIFIFIILSFCGLFFASGLVMFLEHGELILSSKQARAYTRSYVSTNKRQGHRTSVPSLPPLDKDAYNAHLKQISAAVLERTLHQQKNHKESDE